MGENKLATIEDVMAYLGITRAKLAQLRYRGTGPAFVKVGREIRYRWADVDEWIAANTCAQTGESAA